jgi:hypothetical protein
MATKTKKKPRSPATVLVSPLTEWTDFHGILVLFGVRRSMLYHLVETEPELEDATISLKGKDETRGKRLFNVPKFRRFLESRVIAS